LDLGARESWSARRLLSKAFLLSWFAKTVLVKRTILNSNQAVGRRIAAGGTGYVQKVYAEQS
jgi:hypothetical protein